MKDGGTLTSRTVYSVDVCNINSLAAFEPKWLDFIPKELMIVLVSCCIGIVVVYG